MNQPLHIDPLKGVKFKSYTLSVSFSDDCILLVKGQTKGGESTGFRMGLAAGTYFECPHGLQVTLQILESEKVSPYITEKSSHKEEKVG